MLRKVCRVLWAGSPRRPGLRKILSRLDAAGAFDPNQLCTHQSSSKGDSLQKSHHHGQAIAPWWSQPEGSIITVQGDLRDLHVELLTAHRVSDREKPAAVGRAERLS